MREKTRKLLLAAVMAALTVSLTAASLTYAFTFAKYTKEKSAGGVYGSEIEYVGAQVYGVKTAEELSAAIDNGYSYIEIDEDAKDPFDISDTVADITADLVLDLNGKTIRRNSRNPVFNVLEGVSVMIVDGSETLSGGIRNPVGSLFLVDGGTLTVAAGTFESGPRRESASVPGETAAATLYCRDNYSALAANPSARAQKAEYATVPGVTSMPVLTEDFYYETAWGDGSYIAADTYLIYSEEEDAENFNVLCDAASCDFYYTYPLAEGRTAVVYGYNDVLRAADPLDAAQPDAGLIEGVSWPYAVINMEEGNAHARAGKFHTCFGKEYTYGIYSRGGVLSVGVENSADNGIINFFAEGSGTCIYGVGGKLTVDCGTFVSQDGDTVHVAGNGEDELIAVNRGVFEKTLLSDAGRGTAVIRGDGGKIALNRAEIHLKGAFCAGVLSRGGTIALGGGTEIRVSGAEGNLLSSTAVSSEGGGLIELSGTVTIRSDSLGVTARGDIEVKSDAEVFVGTADEKLRATGIYVNNGSMTVEAGASVSVYSQIDSAWKWVDADGSPQETFNQYNGVYVQGGSLACYGELNVDHTGVESDVQSGSADRMYRDYIVKSYAVRVENAGENAVVEIDGGAIRNAVGGGLFVSGGSVVLGTENGGPTIRTSGVAEEGVSETVFSSNVHHGNWQYAFPKKGGPAVKINGGSLSVYGGSYEAGQGDGIAVFGGERVQIFGGTFVGRDSYWIDGSGTYYGGSNGKARSGPAASYAFKAYGGTTEIYGGTFGTVAAGEVGSGAYVTGDSAEERARVTVADGTFSVSNGNDGGQMGFAVGPYAEVTFGTEQGTGPFLSGIEAGLTLEAHSPDGGDSAGASAVTILGGTFQSTWLKANMKEGEDERNSNGIYYNNPNATLSVSGGKMFGAQDAGLCLAAAPMAGKVNIAGGELTGQEDGIYYAKAREKVNGGLTISGGTFTGITRSGLYLNAQPRSREYIILQGYIYYYHIRLTGGTFVGNPSKQYYWIGGNYWLDGAIAAHSTRAGDGLGYDIGAGYLFDTTSYYADCYYDGSWHSVDNDTELNQSTARASRVIIRKK
ncbi:MAG: hypothetical protein KH436_03395 [Firmicutes bacterium]|nr:hypothetical protein [Bacillota bacterium]